MIYFSRIRDVKLPTRGTPRSAGIDFYVPKIDAGFMDDFAKKNTPYCHGIEFEYLGNGNPENILLSSHAKMLIPSGIKARIPTGFALIAFNKSGVSSKQGLDVLASVVDEDYMGEIHISIVNTSTVTTSIPTGSKLIQFILIPMEYADIKEVPIKDLYPEQTERGEGGFGSTGHV